MVSRDDITALVNARLNRVLRVAEAALSDAQFRAFRRVTLDEFGRDGLGRDLARLLGDQRDNNK